MNNYVIVLKIDSKDMKILKDGNYNLCLACSLKNEDYNVIWYATNGFAPVNRIELGDEYEVFASLSSIPKKTVSEDFAAVIISEGEECILDAYGNISTPFTSASTYAIRLANEYGNIHPGLKQNGIGINQESFCNPIFLSPCLILPGSYEFIPCREIKVWFEQNAASGMIVRYQKRSKKSRSAITLDIELNLDKNPNPVITYCGGVWKIT